MYPIGSHAGTFIQIVIHMIIHYVNLYAYLAINIANI